MIPWAIVENEIRRVPDSREVEEFCRLEKDRSNTLNLKYHVIMGFEDQPGNRKKINDNKLNYQYWLLRLRNRFIGRANDVGQR